MALIEMNKMRLKGREISLKLAHPKQQRSGGGRRNRSGVGSSSTNAVYGAYIRPFSEHINPPPRSFLDVDSAPSRTYTESVIPPSAEEHNEFVLDADWDFQMALDSARFSKLLIPPDLKSRDLAVKLYEV